MSLISRNGSSRVAFLVAGALFVLFGSVPAELVWGDDPATVDPIPPAPSSESPMPPTASHAYKLWKNRSLNSLKASVKPTSGELPTNLAAPRMAEAVTLYSSYGENRPWMLSSYEWEAPSTRHLPLLFEEPNLERLGYTHRCYCHDWDSECGSRVANCLQPVVSGIHFFGRIPFMPYMWGYQCPCEPVYTLGVDRPGSPVCYRRYQIPLDLKGALYQAGAVVGLVFLIP